MSRWREDDTLSVVADALAMSMRAKPLNPEQVKQLKQVVDATSAEAVGVASKTSSATIRRLLAGKAGAARTLETVLNTVNIMLATEPKRD